MYHNLAFTVLLFLVLLILLVFALLVALLVLLTLLILALLIFVTHDSPPTNKIRIVDLFVYILPKKTHHYTSRM